MECNKCNRNVKGLYRVEIDSKVMFWCIGCIKMANPGSGLTGYESITEVVSMMKDIFKKRTNTN